MAVWYSLSSFVIFFSIWYVWTKKNLATLLMIVGLDPGVSLMDVPWHGMSDVYLRAHILVRA
jgi:hypothetical protein